MKLGLSGPLRNDKPEFPQHVETNHCGIRLLHPSAVGKHALLGLFLEPMIRGRLVRNTIESALIIRYAVQKTDLKANRTIALALRQFSPMS